MIGLKAYYALFAELRSQIQKFSVTLVYLPPLVVSVIVTEQQNDLEKEREVLENDRKVRIQELERRKVSYGFYSIKWRSKEIYLKLSRFTDLTGVVDQAPFLGILGIVLRWAQLDAIESNAPYKALTATDRSMNYIVACTQAPLLNSAQSNILGAWGRALVAKPLIQQNGNYIGVQRQNPIVISWDLKSGCELKTVIN